MFRTAAFLVFILSLTFNHCLAEPTRNLSGRNIQQNISYDSISLQAGKASCERSDWGNAIISLDKVIRGNTQIAPVYEYRGLAYFSTGDYKKAISDFSRAISLDPKNDRAYLNRGCAFRALNQLEKAEADLNESIKLNGVNATAYKMLAAIYHARADFKREIDNWDKALRFDSQDTTPLVARGWAFFQTGQFEKSIRDYQAAITKEPNDDRALSGLAWVYATCPDKNLRNGKAAIENATKACDLTDWTQAEWIDTLATAYAETGDYISAIKYEIQAIGVNKNGDDRRAAMQRKLADYQSRVAVR